jgi:hygromycin-B 7''-O-kinase
MRRQTYSLRLGEISDWQFQAALDRFQLGKLVQAEAIPFGHFGQNVFVTSTKGAYVLRGSPHFPGQFLTEQFYIQLLHKHTSVPVPWPYLIDPTTNIFGWSYVIMPKMDGLQLANEQLRQQLGREEKKAIARAMGENLARMHALTWPFAGRYSAQTNTVEPFYLARELAWPSSPVPAKFRSEAISYSERVVRRLLFKLKDAQKYSAHTTDADIQWAKGYIAAAQKALQVSFQPSLVMEDYKEGNVVVTQDVSGWHVSGVFDMMEAHFGDGEADLSRTIAAYLDDDRELAHAFLQAYLSLRPPRPGFEERFAVYMLLDRAILWNFFQ